MPFQGAVASHTIEFPMTVNNDDYDTLPVEELRRRSAINTDIAGAAMRATSTTPRTTARSVIADQIETFRRGAAGEAQRAGVRGDRARRAGIGPEDVYTTTFPRAYVIPAGAAQQRSATAAARLVDHLVANDVRVERATAAVPARRPDLPGRARTSSTCTSPSAGMANVMLAAGADISADVSTMYDISGWSLGLLWGATVDSGRRAARCLRVPGRTVQPRPPHRLRGPARRSAAAAQRPQGAHRPQLPARAGRQGAAGGRRLGDRAGLGPRSAAVLADRYGVVFTATKETGTGTPLRRTRVAAAVTAGELFALREMGFEVHAGVDRRS